VAELAELAEFRPGPSTQDSLRRRKLYQAESRRKVAEQEHPEGSTEFLATLGLEMTVRPASEADLARAHELTVRTHQLNTTGTVFSMDELRELRNSAGHEVLVATLEDRFGSYGTIGLAVNEFDGGDSVLKLLLMSCRVMSRGVGRVLLDHLVTHAIRSGRRPTAHFVPTEVNRIMLVTLRFAGFEVGEDHGDHLVLAVAPGRTAAAGPGHVRLISQLEEAR
jgi:FkbH-like protein